MLSPGPSRRHWLDRLPVDVCERLVLHVTGGNPTAEGLSLARTSAKMRTAVRETVGPKILLPSLLEPLDSPRARNSASAAWQDKWLSDSDFAGAWLELLKEDVVDFTAHWKFSKRLTIVDDLLKSPTLQKVTIFDKRTLFAAIGQSRSIRELSVSFRSKKYGPVLFEALQRMDVEKLCFECKSCDGSKSCPFQDSTLFNSNYNAIAVSCPNLKSLQMWCTLNGNDASRDGSTAPVWSIFPEIPTLKELTFNGEAPDEAIPKLSKLDSVEVSWAADAYRLAMRVGTPITGLGTHTPFNDEMIRGLTRCPRLKKLALDFKTGTEVALADVFRELPLLSEISLQWESRDECEHGDLDEHNCYTDAVPGAMYSAVQAAPNLTVINLTYVRLPLDEMQDILSSAGEGLEEVMTSIDDQDETPCERLRSLLLTAAKSNPGLRSFEVCDMSRQKLLSGSDVEIETPSLKAAVERLSRHAPRLSTSRLEKFIADYAR